MDWNGRGLRQYNPRSGQQTAYVHDPFNPDGLSSNEIFSIYQDRAGIVWVGTARGLDKLDPVSNRFPAFHLPAARQASSTDNLIARIREDAGGVIWICIQGKVWQYHRKSGRYLPFQLPRFPQDLYVDDVLEAPSGRQWLATSRGLIHFDPSTGQSRQYLPRPEEPSHPRNHPRKLFLDQQGNLWMENGDEMGRFNPQTGTFIFYAVDSNINDVQESTSGYLWVATNGKGLLRLDPTWGKWIRYLPSVKRPTGKLSNADVRAIHEDQQGNLWLGTFGGGLNQFNPTTGQFTVFTEADGLPSNIIHHVIADNRGYLWLNTEKGLCQFNLRTHTCRNYDTYDGLASEVNYCMTTTHRGEILLSGERSFTIFHPDHIPLNAYVPPVVITGFERAGKPAELESDSLLELPYQDNTFAFEFAALSYSNAPKNQYAYRLKGLDQDWVYSGSRRFASFTHLAPGRYVFQVKAANNDGVWNEKGTSMTVVIHPPWWRTTWAYAFYGLLTVISLLLARREVVKRERLRADLHIKQVESTKWQELDALKSRFFANISHEFRTPLTLILGTLEELLQDRRVPIHKQQQYHLLQRNAGRLLQLINQLLDLSRLEAGGLQLAPQAGNLTGLLHSIAYSFTALAESRGIDYQMH